MSNHMFAEISPLKCFTEKEVSEEYKHRWTCLYNDYLRESSSLCKLTNKEEKSIKFRELYQKYKRILYHAEEFEESPRGDRIDLLQEACAELPHQVVYERAMPGNEVSKCGFAWKVAGRALCQLCVLERSGDTVLSRSGLWPMLSGRTEPRETHCAVRVPLPQTFLTFVSKCNN
ncbi:hypothetical protein PR202_ga23152 [Eleusine coracana subsp. coracana]|uniref:RDRP C-terminal head domain-containing protein n=1 Tax=Eleusine coracana subsp. coracana TaxID=191504 RepID=A0AAV5D5I5_ELECO|nr:hypothetical protein PR202_ga23152 [Eleusine coracana subsp. coracana]